VDSLNERSAVRVPLMGQFSVRERETFFGVVRASLGIDCHLQFVLWLQGVVQHLLPHDVLLSVSDGFEPKVDVLSSLPSVPDLACMTCDHELISDQLFERWRHNGRQVLAIDSLVGDLFDDSCDCPAAAALKGSPWALVHGVHGKRTGSDTLYVVLGLQGGSSERRRALFAMLLPVIDSTWRRVEPMAVVPLEVESSEGKTVMPREDVGISFREHEILSWVRAGKTNYEIGRILNISAFTVKNHLQRIYRKIDVINRAQAVAKIEEYARSR